jgi:hypothetical protein
MHKAVVEFGGVPVGIVIPLEGVFQFMAVKYHVMGLDGRRFRSLSEVNIAIRAHLSGGTAFAA